MTLAVAEALNPNKLKPNLIIGRDGQSETVGKASHPVKIYINDVAHAMTHHRSDAHASACQKVLRSDSIGTRW